MLKRAVVSDTTSEATVRRHLEYLRLALRELLHLPADAPDEDLIDTLRERLKRADVEHYDAIRAKHSTVRAREYEATLWAAANMHWPDPLRVSTKALDAWSLRCHLLTTIDNQSWDVLIYGVPETESIT